MTLGDIGMIQTWQRHGASLDISLPLTNKTAIFGRLRIVLQEEPTKMKAVVVDGRFQAVCKLMALLVSFSDTGPTFCTFLGPGGGFKGSG